MVIAFEKDKLIQRLEIPKKEDSTEKLDKIGFTINSLPTGLKPVVSEEQAFG